jgi:hypothetical protein
MMAERESVLRKLERDGELHEPHRLRERIEALDWLDAHFPDGGFDAGLETETNRRAKTIYDSLEAANCELYQAILGEIQHGARPDTLLRFATDTGQVCGSSGLRQAEGYDYLDDLIAGVLQLMEPDAQRAALQSGMVAYQPTPARQLFDWIGRGTLSERDVVMDLGSGLGHVALLTAICTPAQCVGIEVNTSYVDCARRSAEALNLSNAMFLQQDVRDADLSPGTVFYLYTPFTGEMLRTVLDLLQREATRREIRVCTYGPCTPVIAEQQWLKAAGGMEADGIAELCSRT